MIGRRELNGILELRLERGKGNALDRELLEALDAALAAAGADPPRGLILTGSAGFFCAGLDLVALEGIQRDGLGRILELLCSVGRRLFELPRPVVAAMNGHAIAGGAYLSLACDLRIMAQGQGQSEPKWGLSEASLGLALPGPGVEMARYALPRPVLEKVLYGGSVYPAFKAFDMGILDALVDGDGLMEEARRRVESWTVSRHAFADIKRRLHAPVLAAMERAREDDDRWLDLWYSDVAQTRMAQQRSRLTSRSRQCPTAAPPAAPTEDAP